MSELVAPLKKWACEYCTYENWQATKKCTLCRAPRPPLYINEAAPTSSTPYEQQDIYKMAPLVSSPSPTTSASLPTSHCVKPAGTFCTPISPTATSSSHTSSCESLSAKTAKWACQMCTYLNWPKSQKCTQCITPRPKLAPIASTTAPPSVLHHDDSRIKPLSINVNIAEASMRTACSSHGSSSSCSMVACGAGARVSPRTSPNSPESAKAINNDKNRAAGGGTIKPAVAPSRGKWTCQVCTYENWPRSIKCVLCGTGKGRTYLDLSPGSERSTTPNDELNIHSMGSNRRSPPGSARSPEVIEIQAIGGAAAATSPNTLHQEKQDRNKTQDHRLKAQPIPLKDDRRLRQFRNSLRDMDWLWLNACKGVVEGNSHALEAYLASGGDAARQLTVEECSFLTRPSAFQPSYTLVQLALRFQREDMLTVLLSACDVSAKGKKRVPSHVSPDVAAEILREIAISLRQRKGDFPCFFLTDLATFSLPAEIEDLPHPIQKQLFDELLDRDVQKELEVEEPIINWSLEITTRLGSRMYALWNRTAGDCLLDSALQATWGVFDRDNSLRRALADSLVEGANSFYLRWKETETIAAHSLSFSLDEAQWQQDWAILLSLASQPGASLEQIHIFTLAHILRRPIIVYGIKFVKSFRGENIGLAKFQGVYLPLLWERSFCWKTPITLGYTRGHFSALVPMEIDTDENIGAGANIEKTEQKQIVYLPLMDCEGKTLPIHFLNAAERGREETLLREWMECCVTESGLLVAQQNLTKRPLLVRQMVNEWLDRYRRLSHLVQQTTTVNPHSSSNNTPLQPDTDSDGETDDE